MMSRRLIRVVIGVLGWLLLSVPWVWGAPVTAARVQRVAENWLSRENQPLGAPLGPKVKEVRTFADDLGNPLYFVVYLDPSGLIIMGGDDLVEPIVAFSPSSFYDPSPANPLGAMVSRDVPGRVALVRQREAQAREQGLPLEGGGPLEAARRKWESLDPQERLLLDLSKPSEELVPPLVESQWDQGDVGGTPCYNYYTPKHYLSGCVPTAMSQVMRYWKHPTAGIGQQLCPIWVDHLPTAVYTLGGDGFGGPYKWDKMVLKPGVTGADTVQRAAIGALCHDAGVVSGASYTSSVTNVNEPEDSCDALIRVFQYNCAKFARVVLTIGSIPINDLYQMVNPNLDAKAPVILGVAGGGTVISEKHAVVCDGYGSNYGTMYHHLNMGFGGTFDSWYNMPNMDTIAYDMIKWAIYNIWPEGAGEVISGRVTDVSGNPLSGATVSAAGGGFTYSVTTNDKGIYALPAMPSGKTFSINCVKSGYTFNQPPTVTTGTSINGTTITGNRWGINFRASVPVGWEPKYRLISLADANKEKKGKCSRAFAINNRGQVAGAMKPDNAFLPFHPYIWTVTDTGVVTGTDLGTLGTGNDGELRGLNDNGLAVGWSQKDTTINKYPCYATSSTSGGVTTWTLKELPSAHSNTNGGSALGVNSGGIIVGKTWYYPPDAMLYACYWPDVTSQPLPLNSGTGSPAANYISSAENKIAGVIDDRAVMWRSGAGGYEKVELDPTGKKSEAFSISYSLGPVGFYTNADGNQVACTFKDGVKTELGSLGGKTSVAYGANNQWQIVGQATNASGRGRAFLWDSQNGMQDLNLLVDEPDWILNTAYAINEKGEIAGWGFYKGVFDFAFVLQPIPKKGVITGLINLLLAE